MARVTGQADTPTARRLRTALDDAGLTEASGHDEVRIGDSMQRRGRGRLIVLVPAAEFAGDRPWHLLANGADDVLAADDPGAVDAVVARLRRWRTIDELVTSAVVTSTVIGSSPALRRALVELLEFAVFGTGPILLLGETGTGKEVLARLVHQVLGKRSSGPFVVVDCTTIVPSLSGSELFGHERGAFTGAERARPGAFAAANGGTLFLDEIGELPLPLQAELLRVLQEGTYKPVGGDTWVKTRFRLVSATNRDLDAEQRAGRFRSDLYHRIASGVVRLPALRERSEDIVTLFAHFLADAVGEPLIISEPVAQLLRARSYPGNLRELRQLAYAVAARHCGPGAVTPGDLPHHERPAGAVGSPQSGLDEAVRNCLAAGMSLQDLKAQVGDLAVDAALERAGGNVRSAAESLQVTVRAIQIRRQRGSDVAG